MKPYNKRSNRLTRKLSKIEDKLDTLLSDLTRINIRLLAIEQIQKGAIMDETINKLHESAQRMREMASIENETVKKLLGL